MNHIWFRMYGRKKSAMGWSIIVNGSTESIRYTAGAVTVKRSEKEYLYFIRLFKKYMKVSPYQYLKDYRFSMAISLLKAGNKVADVAEMVGYSSVHAFSNAVKKIWVPLLHSLNNFINVPLLVD